VPRIGICGERSPGAGRGGSTSLWEGAGGLGCLLLLKAKSNKLSHKKLI